MKFDLAGKRVEIGVAWTRGERVHRQKVCPLVCAATVTVESTNTLGTAPAEFLRVRATLP